MAQRVRAGLPEPVSQPPLKVPGTPGQIILKAEEVVQQNTTSNAPIDFQTPNLIRQEIKEEQHTKVSHSGLCDPNIQMALNIGVTMAVAWTGVGACAAFELGLQGSVGGLLVAGATNAAVAKGAMSFINNAGDPSAVFKQMTSSDALKSYLIEGIAAGVIDKIGTTFDIPMAPSMDAGKRAAEASQLVGAEASMLENFGNHLRAQLIRNVVRAPLNAAIGGQDVDDVMGDLVRSTVADTIGGWGAGEIGLQYKGELIDTVTHQLMHALNGAATKFILNGRI